MAHDILAQLPTRRGHFRLESGLHTDLWMDLDRLFESPRTIAPLVESLADRLRPYNPSGICGPLQGGAFLAQALATTLGVNFYFSEPEPFEANAGLFGARYRLPRSSRRTISGEQIAVVDDVISAGSSVRATTRVLLEAGASVAVVASLLVLGLTAIDHFAGLGTPVETLDRREFALWLPEICPLCRAGELLEDPLNGGGLV